MGFVKQLDKRSGITYVYENHPYWDKEQKKHRAHRKLIGRLNTETGEIIPTDGRCRKRAEQYPAQDVLRMEYEKALSQHESDQVLIQSLQREIQLLRTKIDKLDQ